MKIYEENLRKSGESYESRRGKFEKKWGGYADIWGKLWKKTEENLRKSEESYEVRWGKFEECYEDG